MCGDDRENMKKPEMPQDEFCRLETLRSLDILDTDSEERFDRLTRLATRLFDVPIALVSLVDENRQWFKSRAGLEALETSRDISFCGHSILGDDIFVVEDTLQDVRFADNPLVTGPPDIRFYAGCPLKGAEGYKLGTLCLIDTKPRMFTEDDFSSLRDLAGMAEQELAVVQLATLDELTGISNRRGFEVLAQKALNVCERNKRSAVLIFIDLDGFKQINDQFGHCEGDKALQVFSESMRATWRDSDIFARLGGDEFVVLLTDSTLERASKSISRLREFIAQSNVSEDRGYSISFSEGIVEVTPERGMTIAELLEKADTQMYQAKAIN